MDIITRAGTSQDVKAVAQFWSEHSGWGEILGAKAGCRDTKSQAASADFWLLA